MEFCPVDCTFAAGNGKLLNVEQGAFPVQYQQTINSQNGRTIKRSS
jgi:hypothetical protein